jgi:geranylgeranyl reductase family protein
MTYDVAIIGGGPAGTSAAITAARDGARVLLLERGAFPRQKVCGEFVSPESLSLLRSLLRSDAAEEVLSKPVQISSSRTFIDGHAIHTEISPPAYSIPRYVLDSLLWQEAQSAGADCRQQITVDRVSRNAAGFTVETSHGEFSARAVINASGRWSNFKAETIKLSAGPKWIGLKAHFAEAETHSDLDLYFFTGGYCGIAPIGNGQINACAMVRADVAKSLSEVFRCDAQLEQRSRGWRAVVDEVTTAPLVFHTPTPVADNVLLAGDAAGFIDPFVGDGISMALHSGAMAAISLVVSEYDAPRAAARYREQYQRRLLPAFSNAARLRRLMALPRIARWPVVKMMKVPGISEFLLRQTRAGVVS